MTCASLLVLAAGCSTAGGLPPAKFDLGRTAIRGPSGDTSLGTSLQIGIHYATVNPRPSPFDFGVGYVGTFLPETASSLMQPSRLARQVEHPVESAHGGFIEGAARIDQRRHVRTWISGRGELLETQGRGVLGLAGRVTTELWTGVAAGARRSGVIGVLALGLYGEAGIRESKDGLVRTVSIGITGRIPFVFAH